MAISTGGQIRIVKTSSKPRKAPPEKFPWPRSAPDDPSVQLGIDVVAKLQDITKIVHKHFHIPDVPMEELMQEIFATIIHKNYTKSAHDPRKSSFSHYVYMISDNVCINIINRKKRFEREKESLDAPCQTDNTRTLLDTINVPTTHSNPDDNISDYMKDIEDTMRRRGHRDLARYVRVVRSGASPDIIKEVLSWDNHKISNDAIRDFRVQVKEWFAVKEGSI